MKATVSEYEGCFSIELEAETLQDAAFLTRMGLDGTKELRSASAYAHTDGSFYGSVVIGKAKKAHSQIQRKR